MAGESARELARRQREKAARLLRAAERYEKGADGEEATAQALSALPVGEWTVFHDVRWPDRRLANVDHVVVGPAGVFVIDTKNWSGTITVKDDVLRQNGYRRESEVANAAEASLAVTRLVPDVPPSAVFAILCFTTDRPLSGYARDVAVCTTANLVEMLVTRPTVLTREQRLWTTTRLDVRLVKATRRASPAPHGQVSVPSPRAVGAGPVPAVPRPSIPPRTSGRARRHKGGASVARFVVAALAVASFYVAVTRTDLVDRFSDHVVHLVTPTEQPSPIEPAPMRHIKKHPKKGPSGTETPKRTR